MDSFVQADIFFFITAVAVCAVTVLASVALYHAIAILKDIREFMAKLRAEGDAIVDDVAAAHQFMRREGVRLAGMVSFLGHIFGRRKRTRKSDAEKE